MSVRILFPIKAPIIVICIYSASSSSAADVFGKVISVADGDAVTVLTLAKKQLKVRLDSIDAPEKGQPYGQNAQKALADKVAGREVLIKSNDKDRYGRTIGVVMLARRNINREMVAGGHA